MRGEEKWERHLEAIGGEEPLRGAAGNSSGVSSGSSLLHRAEIMKNRPKASQFIVVNP